MSTIGYENWAVDLADVGAIYPMQGWEVPMTIIGVLFWLDGTWCSFAAKAASLRKLKKTSVPKVSKRRLIDTDPLTIK